jgi:hypothetical protein
MYGGAKGARDTRPEWANSASGSLELSAYYPVRRASDRRGRGSVESLCAVTGHNNMAALSAGDMLRLAGHPAHVVGAALTALKSRLAGVGPVALRDVDALCIKGWSKMRPY